MRKKLSFLSGLATVIVFLYSFTTSTYAATNLSTTNSNTAGSVSGNVYGVTGNIYGCADPGVTGNVYGVTGNVYGVADDRCSDQGVTGDVYATPPAAPTTNPVTDQYTIVTGKAEVGAIVSVTIGDKKYTAISDTKGNYQVTIPQQKAGTTITVTATDHVGNVSKATKITVLDKTAPTAPRVNAVSDQSGAVTGTAEAGSTVRVALGTKTYKAVASGKGNFEVKIAKEKAGTTITVTATDQAGNESKATKVTVLDKTAPSAPRLNAVSDHSGAVTGTAEAGSTVKVTIGKKTYKAVTSGKGIYDVKIPTQKAGTTITVTATDHAGNVSKATKVTVLDKTAPSAARVNPVSGRSVFVTGRAEAGSTVRVTIGTKTYKAVTNGKGIYDVKIPKQKAGTAVTVTATDHAGNVSKATRATVHR